MSEDIKKEEEVLSLRLYGKSIKMVTDFIIEGRKGKAIVYSTPEGDFLSPEAVKRAIKRTIKKAIDKATLAQKKKDAEIVMEKFYELEEWYTSSERPNKLTYFEANQRNIEMRNNLCLILNQQDDE